MTVFLFHTLKMYVAKELFKCMYKCILHIISTYLALLKVGYCIHIRTSIVLVHIFQYLVMLFFKILYLNVNCNCFVDPSHGKLYYIIFYKKQDKVFDSSQRENSYITKDDFLKMTHRLIRTLSR